MLKVSISVLNADGKCSDLICGHPIIRRLNFFKIEETSFVGRKERLNQIVVCFEKVFTKENVDRLMIDRIKLVGAQELNQRHNWSLISDSEIELVICCHSCDSQVLKKALDFLEIGLAVGKVATASIDTHIDVEFDVL